MGNAKRKNNNQKQNKNKAKQNKTKNKQQQTNKTLLCIKKFGPPLYASRPVNRKVNDEECRSFGIGFKGMYISCEIYLLTYARRSQWSIGHQRPPAIALCSGLLLSFRTSWSPAVSALLQCLTSNCCEAGPLSYILTYIAQC